MQRSRTVLGAVVLCLTMTALAGVQAPARATSPGSFEEALAQAETRGTSVLLEFYTEW